MNGSIVRRRRAGKPFLWVLIEPRSAEERRLLLAATLAGLPLITWIDTITGRQFSFSVVYLLPVVAAAVLVSTKAGYWMSLASAIAWLVARELLAPDSNVWISVWNVVLRTVTVGIIVYLLGALRTALLETAASQQRTEDFLATAAHQIRTPVAGVMASAEALSVERDDVRRKRLTDNLVRSAERLGRLLTALLTLSRLDRVETDGPQDPVDIGEMCQAEVESTAIRFPDIDFQCETPVPVVAPINRLALAEAVANLLENAGRHAVRRVHVEVSATPQAALIAVSDDGSGVNPGMEEQIFERFVAVDGLGGSGLGLPIARGLVESQDGSLTYADRRFRIELPDHRHEADARPLDELIHGRDSTIASYQFQRDLEHHSIDLALSLA